MMIIVRINMIIKRRVGLGLKIRGVFFLRLRRCFFRDDDNDDDESALIKITSVINI